MFQCLSYFAMIELQVDEADYQVVQSFFSYGGVYSSEYGLHYAPFFFRYLNYGCVLWGTNYLAPILQLVKLQNEVVRNANNVMTSWPCDFSSFICEPWPH